MKLSDFIKPELVWVIERAQSRDGLLHDLTQRIAAVIPKVSAEALYDALIERERKGSTAVPEGVAFPHATTTDLDRSVVAAALIRGGVDFETDRCAAVDVVFVLLGSAEAGWEHVRLLARLARICHTPGTIDRIRSAKSGQELYMMLTEEDARHV